MINLAIVAGSTRPNRRSRMVAEWVLALASEHRHVSEGRATVSLVDLADLALPLLDEPAPAMFGTYEHEHTRRWADTVASFDGYVFVTPEYNHGASAALKNAVDYLWAEWTDKAAGFVSYGVHGGVRAVEQLRLILAEVKVATVRTQVALSMFTDFIIGDPTQPGSFQPAGHHAGTLDELVDELVDWASALRSVRQASTPS